MGDGPLSMPVGNYLACAEVEEARPLWVGQSLAGCWTVWEGKLSTAGIGALLLAVVM